MSEHFDTCCIEETGGAQPEIPLRGRGSFPEFERSDGRQTRKKALGLDVFSFFPFPLPAGVLMATQKEIAEHLNLSDRQIRNLSNLPGSPVPRGRGEYDLNAWRYFYIEYLRARSRDISDGDEPEDEEISPAKGREQHLKNEERQERILMARIKRRILARRYAPIELISTAVSRTAIELRTRVEAWPPRLKKIWPDMPADASQLLQQEIAKALNELANIRIDLSDYDVGDIERDLDRIESLASDAADDGSGVG